MSEYQYYEFRAIDRRLTAAEQEAVSRLSSRVHPHPTRAVFTYSYSDFRGDPEQVLAKYYDALFYIANWGSVQLAFRFPKATIDLPQIEAYCITDDVTCHEGDDVMVMSMARHEEGGFDFWIEGEGMIDDLLPLREDILRGDYRVLYLAWLSASENEWEVEEDDLEPPVPPGLTQLSPPLQEFVDLFSIDKQLLQVAVAASLKQDEKPAANTRQAILDLPPDEQQAWLYRLAEDEPMLSVKFQRRLHELSGEQPVPSPHPRRTAGELRAAAKAARAQERARRKAKAEAARIRRLKALAEQEEETWTSVAQLIGQKKANAYDEAVTLLVKLRELAAYKGQEAVFQQRVDRIHIEYHRLHGLRRRLRAAGLGESV